MDKIRASVIVVGLALCPALLVAVGRQAPIGAQITLKGEIVDAVCYATKGIATTTGAQHVACAKECARKEGAIFGVLTDGDGLFKIIGEYTANHHAKLLDFLGQQVEVTGTRARYLDYSTAINVTKIAPVSKKSS